jgi:hypothetical protein
LVQSAPFASRRLAAPRALLAGAVLAFLAAAASGQVIDDREELDFDRPEAWAMAWFSVLTFPTVLASPTPLDPGELELSFEGGSVPSLSAEQRTVGFGGGKPEDLNRSSVVGRGRLAVGLPGQLTATLGWVPPVELNGVTPNVLSLAVGRPLWRSDRAAVAARLLAEGGTMHGDLTCPADVVEGRAPNDYGCEGPSDDELSVRLLGLELQGGMTLERWPTVAPYLAIARSRVHAEFQVDNHRNGLHDLSYLETDGSVWSGTLGIAIEAGSRARLAGEVFYSPLDVVGRVGKGEETDGLLNARVLLGYRIR